jgi:small subunit ribosomal protein S8
MLKNASRAGRPSIVVPYSKLKHAIADGLSAGGYLSAVSKKTKKEHPVLELSLTYTGGTPKLSDVKRLSKPSRRVYMSVKEIRPVKNGHGSLFLSTPKGILTDKEARKELVGGEALFMVW